MLAEKVQQSLEFIRTKTDIQPLIGLILGSGLGALAEEIDPAAGIPYRDIPHFPVSTVEGHAGMLVLGTLQGQQVVAMQGRFHHYEGYSLQEVTYPVRVMQKLGVQTLIATNAAGGINLDFSRGELMLITDHINLIGDNPLIGPNAAEFGPRFPDMSEAYNRRLLQLAEEVAEQNGFSLKKGVYAGLKGPSYETPAEIRFLRTIGADAVGMSTVPEVIAANHGGIKVLGISCVTNMAAGVSDTKLSHDEVMETANRVQGMFLTLVKGIVKRL